MRERLLITTAIGLMLGAGAYAQSRSEQPKKQLASGGAKSEQFEFVSAVGVLFDTVFAEFDAVDPEHAVIAFRELKIANDDKPIDGRGQQ
jgi:hypothetical protein